VIHVLDEDSVEEALEISASVDAILLDSGNPNYCKGIGGTGGRITGNSAAGSGRGEVPGISGGGLNP
jgi:phosphoribosylanthranilate isomerase